MNLREEFEKEINFISGSRIIPTNQIYIEWLEQKIEKMKCCECCRYSKFDFVDGIGLFDLWCELNDCTDKDKWELKED